MELHCTIRESEENFETTNSIFQDSHKKHVSVDLLKLKFMFVPFKISLAARVLVPLGQF